MDIIESGGCAPPVLAPTLPDRIDEYLRGETDYDVRQLLRDARDELRKATA